MTRQEFSRATSAPREISFFSTFGKLPGTWFSLALIVIAGMCEGVGIALFIPVIQMMDGGATGPVLDALRNVLSVLGLPLHLVTTLVLVVMLVVSAFALAYCQLRVLNLNKYRELKRVRARLFDGLFDAKWGHLSAQSHGEIVNLLMVEAPRRTEALAYQLRTVATAVLVVIYAGLGAVLSWELLLLAIIFAVSVFAFLRPLIARSRKAGREVSRANREFSFHLVDFIKSGKLIKATGSEAEVSKRFETLNLTTQKVYFEIDDIAERTNFVVNAVPAVLLAALIGIAELALDVPTSYTLVFLLFMARMVPRLMQVQQFFQMYVMRVPAVSSVERRLEECRAQFEEWKGTRTITRIEDGVRLDDVSFGYPSGEVSALHHVTMDIGANSFVAIVGHSGSGKSTLLDMIGGLWQPSSGTVLVDGIDLADINIREWRRRIGLVSQDVTVFNDTIRNNLLFFRPNATDAEIDACLEAAYLKHVVESLPKGLDTVLGENGMRLSGGERQRLALARALIGKPEILLLDEATSALDNESERLVQKAIEGMAHELTLVVVAHRLSTVRRADRIYVLDQGRVVESGSYAELIARGGHFAQLNEFHEPSEAVNG